jgi:hypothetical protein
MAQVDILVPNVMLVLHFIKNLALMQMIFTACLISDFQNITDLDIEGIEI